MGVSGFIHGQFTFTEIASLWAVQLNIGVNERNVLTRKIFAACSRVLVSTELAVSRTQCIYLRKTKGLSGLCMNSL